MAVIHHRLAEQGLTGDAGVRGEWMFWSLVGLRPRIPGPTQLPTADLALRPLHRAGLVAGPRNGGVRYARLRERLHFTPQGFRGMASPTDGEPATAARGVS